MIKVVRTVPAEQTTAWPVGFAATYTVDDTDAKIFVMHQQSGDFSSDQFSCVASSIQMRDLPEDDPAEGSPYFRVADIQVTLRTQELVAEFQESLLDAVQDLVNEITAEDSLAIATEFIIEPTI